jgi:hypothetical protein
MTSFSFTFDILSKISKFVPPDFTINTDTGSYHGHLILVACQSTKIASLLLEDPELKEYTLQVPDPSNLFPQVVSLFEGETIIISTQNALFLNAVADELEIPSLLKECRKYLPDAGYNSLIDFNVLHPFKGIISYFSPITDDHLIKLEVSSSSPYGQPEHLLRQDGAPLYWESDNRDLSYCQFFFPHFKVNLSAYSLRTASNDDELHPKSWGVFGSNDHETWYCLHQVDRINDLVGSGLEGSYECIEKESDEPFQYIRVQQTGANEKGDFVFRLARVELYGQLVAIE